MTNEEKEIIKQEGWLGSFSLKSKNPTPIAETEHRKIINIFDFFGNGEID